MWTIPHLGPPSLPRARGILGHAAGFERLSLQLRKLKTVAHHPVDSPGQ